MNPRVRVALARIDKLLGELHMSVIDATARFADRIGLTRDKDAPVLPIVAESAPPAPAPSAPDTFGEEMARNLETRERMRQERAKANKSVLRSYRIKS